jgi:hypothetical protein
MDHDSTDKVLQLFFSQYMVVAAGRVDREQNIGEWQPCYSYITLDSIQLDSICYDDDSEENTRRVRTLQNLREYSIKSIIFNSAAAWKEMKTTTLPNGWTKLLQDTEPENNFKGFETSDVDKEDDDVVEELPSSCPTLSVIRNHMHDVVSYIGASSDPEVLEYYGHFRHFHSIIIKKQPTRSQ